MSGPERPRLPDQAANAAVPPSLRLLHLFMIPLSNGIVSLARDTAHLMSVKKPAFWGFLRPYLGVGGEYRGPPAPPPGGEVLFAGLLVSVVG